LPGEKLNPSPQPEEEIDDRRQLEARVTQLFVDHKVFSKDFIERKIRELDYDGLLTWEAWLKGQIKYKNDNRSGSA